MTRPLFIIFLLSVLLSSEGCRRQHLSRTAGVDANDVSTPDSTVATRPNRPADSAPATGAGNEPARNSVAQVDFRYLTAKSKIAFKSPTQEIDNATANIRIHRDSLIWLSVSKLGIEGVRALITRDSIMILDKLNHQYAVYDFFTLSQQVNFEMSFDVLQALIVGNLPQPGQPAQTVKNSDGTRLLRQEEGRIVVENYIDETNRKLKKLLIIQPSNRNTLQVDYDEFTPLNAFLFPYASLLTLRYQSPTDGQFQQTVLRSNYNKVELSDQNPGFPFSIPANYQRRP